MKDKEMAKDPQTKRDNQIDEVRITLAVMANDFTHLRATVDEVNQKISQGYVTKEEFEPIKRVVYGLVSLIVIAVVGAMLSLVLR